MVGVGDDLDISIFSWTPVDWRISILVVVTRGCCLGGLHWYGVLFDRGHPRLWNFNPAILVDVVRVESYVNNLFNPTCVPMWV